MKYAIQINSSPCQSNSGEKAYQFIKCVLEMGHEVVRVFFYHDGVYHAFRYAAPPDDEIQSAALWSRLANKFNIDLVVCISAAQRRGLLEATEASRLGQWIEAMLVANRFIEFT